MLQEASHRDPSELDFPDVSGSSLWSCTELILYLEHSWRGPSHFSSLFMRCPGAYAPGQGHLRSIDGHLDAIGIQLCGTSESGTDTFLDVGRQWLALERDEIGEKPHACELLDAAFRPNLLQLPIDGAFERHLAIVHDDANLLRALGKLLFHGDNGHTRQRELAMRNWSIPP